VYLGCWLAYYEWAVIFNPIVPIIGLIASALVAFFIMVLRRRHAHAFGPRA
jgi:hypothetical protein